MVRKEVQSGTQDVNGTSIHRILESHHLDDLDVELLSQFRERKPISGLRLKTPPSERTVYRRINKLLKKDLLEFIKDSNIRHFKVTPGGLEVVDICLTGCEAGLTSVSESASSDEPVTYWIRSHNLTYVLPFQSIPRNLEFQLQRGSWVTGVKRNNKLKNWVKFYGEYAFRDFIAYIEITTQNVIVRLRDIWSKDVLSARAQGAKMIMEVKKELEETFSPSSGRAFRLGNYQRRNAAVVRSQHHAIVLEPLSAKCKENGYSVVGDRVAIDASKGIPETETIHPVYAADDCDFAHNSLEHSIKKRFGFVEIEECIQNLSKLQKDTLKLQESFAQQIKSNSGSQVDLAQILEQQQQFFTQLLTQQNQQILSMLLNFQSNLERILGGRN